MASYIENQLMAGEEVEYKAKTYWIVYLRGLFLITSGLVLVLSGVEALPTLLILLGIIASGWAFIQQSITELAITNKRVVEKFGVLRRHTFDQQLSKIEGINFDQGMLGRILGYASIVVRGTEPWAPPTAEVSEMFDPAPSTLPALPEQVASKALAALRASRAATLWNPAPGDELVGRIVGMRPAIGAFGEQQELLLETSQGETKALWMNSWIEATLRSYHAKVGDVVAIGYRGMEESTRGTRYRAFDLVVERALPTPSAA